ncbi:outer membrane beta-barrel protein [Psychroserpens jangbogonensis]|uniref:outer membrane beta-barrel protein n=1 Tax=Psychroserpens jangbogonensis TaxID=1484460 RepID=UPI00053E7BA1|nr:outer membrane beta-barrel protein [Psychroserpens jangbogonensis]
MKKLMLLAAVAVFSLSNVNAQELRAGLNGGVPIGDAGDFYTFTFGLDVTYLFLEVSEDFQVGAATGYSTSSGDDITSPSITFGGVTIPGVTVEIDSFDYIPLAAAGRYSLSEAFILGLDLGYAIVMTDGADSGLYYRPMVGYNFTEDLQATLSYTGVSQDGTNFSSVLLGVSYKLM